MFFKCRQTFSTQQTTATTGRSTAAAIRRIGTPTPIPIQTGIKFTVGGNHTGIFVCASQKPFEQFLFRVIVREQELEQLLPVSGSFVKDSSAS